jgi:hypothetical protein
MIEQFANATDERDVAEALRTIADDIEEHGEISLSTETRSRDIHDVHGVVRATVNIGPTNVNIDGYLRNKPVEFELEFTE